MTTMEMRLRVGTAGNIITVDRIEGDSSPHKPTMRLIIDRPGVGEVVVFPDELRTLIFILSAEQERMDRMGQI